MGASFNYRFLEDWNVADESPGLPEAPLVRVYVDPTTKMLTVVDSKGNPALANAGGALSCIDATDFGVTGDGNSAFDAVFTNGSRTVTSASANFTAADIGKIVFGTSGPQDGSPDDADSVLVLPQGVISAVLSPNSISVSVPANSSASGTNNGVLLWGSDNTQGLEDTWNAATSGLRAQAIQLPSGLIFTQKGQFNIPANPKCGNQLTNPNSLGITISGWGKLNSMLVPTPNFDFSTANGLQNSCFFGANGISINRLGIWGGGNQNTGSNAKVVVYVGNDGYATDIMIAGWGAQDSALVAFKFCQYVDDIIVSACGHISAYGFSPFGLGDAANAFATRSFFAYSPVGLTMDAGVRVLASGTFFGPIVRADGFGGGGTFFDLGGNFFSGEMDGPTVPTLTGMGDGASAAVATGSTNESGIIVVTAGTSPSSSGQITLRFAGVFELNGNTPLGNFLLSNAGTGSWNPRATAIIASRASLSIVIDWDNNGSNLSGGDTYEVCYTCVPR